MDLSIFNGKKNKKTVNTIEKIQTESASRPTLSELPYVYAYFYKSNHVSSSMIFFFLDFLLGIFDENARFPRMCDDDVFHSVHSDGRNLNTPKVIGRTAEIFSAMWKKKKKSVRKKCIIYNTVFYNFKFTKCEVKYRMSSA